MCVCVCVCVFFAFGTNAGLLRKLGYSHVLHCYIIIIIHIWNTAERVVCVYVLVRC